jgi:WD40 repeat protein
MRIASGSDDETIQVWDTATGQLVSRALAGHTGGVWSVVFSPDGTRIVSGSEDKTIRVWDSSEHSVWTDHHMEDVTQFWDGWFHLGSDKPYLLWVPHAFRQYTFI